MANWKESMNRMAHNVVTKSKELSEISRLNVEVENLEQSKRNICFEVGNYIMEHPELIPAEDEFLNNQKASFDEAIERIEKDKKTILEIKSINICPNCGAEVSRSSKFCDKCGCQIVRQAMEQVLNVNICPNCGAEVDADAMFCGNCGTKIEK